MRQIKWRLGNKSYNESWEDRERRKYNNDGGQKSAYVPVPPLNQITIPSHRYWVAKTDFKITNTIINQIKGVPGIEILKPISPYSFVMAVNSDFFDEEKVKKLIHQKLNIKV